MDSPSINSFQNQLRNINNLNINKMNNIPNMQAMMNNMQNQMMMNNMPNQMMMNGMQNQMMINNNPNPLAFTQNIQNQIMMQNIQNQMIECYQRQMMINNMQKMMNIINSTRENYPNINQMISKNDNINNNENKTKKESTEENLGFENLFVNFNLNNKKVKIECEPDELVFRVIEKFREKANYKDGANFVFNGKNLNLKLTIEQAGLIKNSNILVVAA